MSDEAEIPEVSTRWQDKLRVERDEIKRRSERLGEWINSDLFNERDARGQELMKAQHEVMGQYLAILEERVSRIPEGE